MKYIRTKDGIYETATQNLYKNDDLLYIDGYELEMVIKQADNVEELCDCIIVVSDKRIYDVENYVDTYWKYEYEKVLPQAKIDYPYDKWNIYLGIRTDKGLIYVAKMNEKGELELI